MDNKALYNIGYGLYVVTSNDGKKDKEKTKDVDKEAGALEPAEDKDGEQETESK